MYGEFMEKEDGNNFSARKALCDLWESVQNPECGQSLDEKFLRLAPRGILAVIAVFLAIVIGLVSYAIYKRSEDGMSQLLAEKGASLLNVLESTLRIGMRENSGLMLQALLDDISHEPDIEFVSVALPDGTIIAHSNLERIGEIMYFESLELNLERMSALAPTNDKKWLITTVEGRRVFLVYRKLAIGGKEWSGDVPQPTIFLGLEVSPFEITNSQNRGFVAMLSVVMMLVVLCGLLALSMAQRASQSRKLQRDAEIEVHRLVAEAQHNEKLVAVGTLAAGVAHEIRNPLSSIKGYATYFLQNSENDPVAHAGAQVIVNEVDRLNRVITDLLGLSRPDDTNLKLIDVDCVVDHVRRLLRHNASQRNVKVVCKKARRVPLVLGDLDRLSQALLNICLNAVEAMSEGGTLEIAIAGGKKWVRIITMDCGPGIADEFKSRIFDPYFTTKRSGTGLGLPMADKIVKAHHGKIVVHSRVATEYKPGMTVFCILLPVYDGDLAEVGDPVV